MADLADQTRCRNPDGCFGGDPEAYEHLFDGVPDMDMMIRRQTIAGAAMEAGIAGIPLELATYPRREGEPEGIMEALGRETDDTARGLMLRIVNCAHRCGTRDERDCSVRSR